MTNYDRERAMHEQECMEEMIRMRTSRSSGPHPDPTRDVEQLQQSLTAAEAEIARLTRERDAMALRMVTTAEDVALVYGLPSKVVDRFRALAGERRDA